MPGPGCGRVSALASVRGRFRSNGRPNSYGRLPDVALAGSARRPILVAAEDVAPQPAEQLVENSLAQAASATWRQLEALAVAFGIAGLLEKLGQLLQPAQVRGGLRVEKLGDLVRIDVRQILRRADVVHLARELVHAVESAELSERALEATAARRPGSRSAGPAPPAAARRASRQAGPGPSAAGRRAAARPSCPAAPGAARR